MSPPPPSIWLELTIQRLFLLKKIPFKEFICLLNKMLVGEREGFLMKSKHWNCFSDFDPPRKVRTNPKEYKLAQQSLYFQESTNLIHSKAIGAAPEKQSMNNYCTYPIGKANKYNSGPCP